MLAGKLKIILILAAPFAMAACVSFSNNSGRRDNSENNDSARYHDSAFNDLNRAPASMNPPAGAGSPKHPMDPVYMRTQGDYQFALGEAYSFEGNHLKAIEAFKTVLIYDQESSIVPMRLAAEYVKMGMLNEAIQFAENAVERNPKSADAHLLLGGLYSTLKSYAKALSQYDEVLKISPKNTEAPMYIGAVYAEQKQFDKAIKYFEALSKNEDYTTPHLAHYYIGRIRTEQVGAQYQKAAEASFKKALEIKHDHVESIMALAGVYEKTGNEEKVLKTLKDFQRDFGPSLKVAEALVQKYLESEKYELAFEQLEILEANTEDSLNVKVKMALVLIEQKKYDQAILRLHDILRHVPDSDKIRFYLAAVYEELNKSDEAIKHFSQIPSGSQFYGEAILHAAYLMKQQKQVGPAIDLVEKGMQSREDIPQLYALYASLLDEKGDIKKAQAVLEKGVKKFPEHVQIRFFLGTVFDRLGDKEKTVENMKLVLKMDPNHIQGLNYLAFTYSEMNTNLDEAEKLVRRALEFEPNDGFILDTLGWVLYKKGDIRESIKVLELAYQRNSTEAVIAEHLGDAYFKQQLVEKAKVMYEKAVENESDLEKAKNIRAKIAALQGQEMKRAERQPASVSDSVSEPSPQN